MFKDGFMKGHSIALPHNYHILHKDTGSDIIKAGHPHYNLGSQTGLPAWAQHRAEARVDVFQPWLGLSRPHLVVCTK